MTNERLSACLDGACDDMEAAVRSIESSDAERDTWSRYHLIGDAMRARSGVQLADAGFAARVLAAVELDEMVPAEASTVTPIDRARRKRAWQPRRVTGWAVAASVAVAVVATLGIVSTQSTDDAPVLVARDVVPAQTTLAAKERGIQPAVQTTGVPTQGPLARPTQAASSVHWSQMPPDAAQQLNGYLINHSRYRAGPSVGGTLGYVRVVSVNGEPVETSETTED